MEPQTTPVATQPVVPVTPQTPSSWSWGGFMFDPVVMVATKNYTYLLLYILCAIPIINLFAMIGIKIYMGLKAHEMIATSHAFANKDEAAGFARGLDHAGKIFFYASLVILGLLLVGLMVALGLGFNALSRHDFPSSIFMWQ